MQCCGKAFDVGSQVSWSLAADPGREFLATVVGDEIAATVTHREEHHGSDPTDNAPKTDGVVRSIQAVRCRYEADPKQPRAGLYPVKGSGVMMTVESADGSDPDDDDAKFVGYLITLEGG